MREEGGSTSPPNSSGPSLQSDPRQDPSRPDLDPEGGDRGNDEENGGERRGMQSDPRPETGVTGTKTYPSVLSVPSVPTVPSSDSPSLETPHSSSLPELNYG